MTPKLTWNPMSSVHFSKNTEKNLEKACKINDESDCITLLDHQKIVKTYIHPKTPYRGYYYIMVLVVVKHYLLSLSQKLLNLKGKRSYFCQVNH